MFLGSITAKMGAQKARDVAREERLEGGSTRADYAGIDFSETPLKLFDRVPCIVGGDGERLCKCCSENRLDVDIQSKYASHMQFAQGHCLQQYRRCTNSQ
jgi:hypothetical protein